MNFLILKKEKGIFKNVLNHKRCGLQNGFAKVTIRTVLLFYLYISGLCDFLKIRTLTKRHPRAAFGLNTKLLGKFSFFDLE